MEYYSFNENENLERIKDSGPQKAAKILIALGKENAAKVSKFLEPAMLEKISDEICKIGTISLREQKKILNEFFSTIDKNEIPMQGGSIFAEDVLIKAFGEIKAKKILKSLSQKDSKAIFAQISQTDPEILASLIEKEHPQVISQILANCSSSVAASIFKLLPQEIGPDIAKRLAKLGKTRPEDIYKIAELFLNKVIDYFGKDKMEKAGGLDTLLNILQHADSSTEQNILENMEKENPDMATLLKAKLVTFESLGDLSNHETRKILSRIPDDNILVFALKGADDNLKRHFLSNVSRNRAHNIIEQWDLAEIISIKQIEKARGEILRLAQILDNKGEIVIRKNKEKWVE